MDRRPSPRSRLAAFYVRNLALVAGGVLEWSDVDPPCRIDIDAIHVAVARNESYAIDAEGRLLFWSRGSPLQICAAGIAYVSAGESGVLAVTQQGRLLRSAAPVYRWSEIAVDVVQAWVGDSADYYVTRGGDLFVSGLAHRGQYGDGLLAAVDGWKQVAQDVIHVCAHTGHAVLLKSDGSVEGTGGNRFGPLGTHGCGDKADRWGRIYEGAVRIATGARNTLAIRADGSLWLWGEHVGLEPVRVLERVTDVACGERHVLAREEDGGLWYWPAGAEPKRLAA